MLNVFRENLRSLKWVLWLVIATFILFFGVSWDEACRRGPVGGQWIARLGNRPVLPEEWRWQAQTLQRFLPSGQQDDVGGLALLSLVERLLVVDDASRFGLEVSDEELDRALRLEFTDPATGAFVGSEQYRQLVRRGVAGSPHATLEGHEAWMRDDRLADRWRALVGDLAPRDDVFVREVLARRGQRAAVRYLVASPEDVPDVQDPDDAEARAYAAANARTLLRGGFLVAFDEATIAPDEMVVSDGQVEQYMRQNPELYASPAQRHGRAILLGVADEKDHPAVFEEARGLAEQLRRGERDFAEAARARSDDAATRDLGGDLGLRTRAETSDLDPVVVASLFGPADAGSTLGPLRGSAGYWILRVEEIREPVLPEVLPEAEMNQVRVFLRSRLVDQVTRRRASDFRRRVASAEQAREQATAAGLPVRDVGAVHQGAVPAGLPGGPLVVAELFDLEEGEVGRVLRLAPGYGVVARLPLPEPPPPADAYLEAARRAIRNERARAALGVLVESARASGRGLDDVARRLGEEPQATDGAASFEVLEETLGAEARRAALGGAALGALAGPFDGPRGAVLLEVVDRPAAATPQDERALRDRTRAALGQILYAGLIEDLRARASADGDLVVRPEIADDLPHRSLDAPRILGSFTIPSAP